MNSRPAVVYVTGFGKFSNVSVNASWEAVKLLPNNLSVDDYLANKYDASGNVVIVIEELPVEYEYINKVLPERWEKLKPQLVIHVGHSEKAQTVTIESLSHGRGYEKPDINSCLPDKGLCKLNEETIESGFDMDKIASQSQKKCQHLGVPISVSKDAGRFLCEYTLHVSSSYDCRKSAFIHVPPIGKPYSAEVLSDVLYNILQTLLEHQSNVA